MPASVNITGRAELQWDQAAIQRNRLDVENAFAIWTPLVATALLPACWALLGANTVQACLFKLAFATDTAIFWTLKSRNTTSAYTAFTPSKLGGTNVINSCIPQAQVAAAPGGGEFIDGGFAAAGSYVDVLAGKWLLPPLSTGVILFTSAVAANVACAMWWTEYNN